MDCVAISSNLGSLQGISTDQIDTRNSQKLLTFSLFCRFDPLLRDFFIDVARQNICLE